jgi:pheromone shutdown protein TraB
LDSGDFFGFLNRLERVNEQELSTLKEQVVADLSNNDNDKDKDKEKDDESAVTVAMMEALKADTGFRTRLFDRLEREVPEFTTAFVNERDYIMSEAIRRELLEQGADHVVGVVGLAHVRGMKKHLEEMLATS